MRSASTSSRRRWVKAHSYPTCPTLTDACVRNVSHGTTVDFFFFWFQLLQFVSQYIAGRTIGKNVPDVQDGRSYEGADGYRSYEQKCACNWPNAGYEWSSRTDSHLFCHSAQNNTSSVDGISTSSLATSTSSPSVEQSMLKSVFRSLFSFYHSITSSFKHTYLVL